MEQHYKISDVAKALDLSRQTVWQWVKDGRVKAVRLSDNGVYRIPQSEVDRLTRPVNEKDQP